LSTITSADQILVLHAGRVAESGTHQELLSQKGRYYNMWRKQIKAERAMEQASQMVAKAQALKEASMDRPGSSGNEGSQGSPSEDVSENEADTKTLVNANIASRAVVKAAESLMDGSSSRVAYNGVGGTEATQANLGDGSPVPDKPTDDVQLPQDDGRKGAVPGNPPAI
jgi:ABC-type glutathione transport system ATPase component